MKYKAEENILPNFKTYYKATTINTEWYGRGLDTQNKTEW